MPRFSVYTPTHDPRWLRESLRSLEAQTCDDWEWVVVRNGAAASGDFPHEVLTHPKVKMLASNVKGVVGALKGQAVSACTGDVFVELDHDDRLTPTCLAELGAAADREPGGFYYSDFASVYPNGAPETFGSDNGWEQYVHQIGEQEYLCQRSFPPTPKALSEIWFAPNHVRAWSREAYQKAGGYDPQLVVGDDHDLICRTYLAKVPVVHVPKPLYIYRRVLDGKGNTFVHQQPEVQRMNYRNLNRYMYPLVEEWCRRKGLPKLDLGGAHNCPEGYIPVDLALDCTSPELFCRDHFAAGGAWPKEIGGEVMDVLGYLPDSCVGCVRAFDFIEHLPRDQMVPFMNECYRVLVPDGFMLTATPSTDGRGAYQDPTHTNYLNQNSFWYYTNRDFSKFLNGAVKCRFQAVRLWTEAPSDWHRQHDVKYAYADLLAIKGFKHIGPIHI